MLLMDMDRRVYECPCICYVGSPWSLGIKLCKHVLNGLSFKCEQFREPSISIVSNYLDIFTNSLFQT